MIRFRHAFRPFRDSRPRWPALFAAAALLFAFGAPVAGAPANEGAKDAPSAEPAEEEAGEGEEANPDRLVIVEPVKKPDPEVAAEQVKQYLRAGKAQWKGGDYAFAESYFAAALGVPAEVPEKETVLRDMAGLYQEAGMFPKAAAVLERLAREFPDSPRLPEVYMELAGIYRKMGARELAIAKYYAVMNASINVSFDQIDKYRQLSLQAKLAIADTHADRGEHQEAYRLYQALIRAQLPPSERMRAHYRMCYLLYNLGNYEQGIAQMQRFLEAYPQSPHEPEIRYLLATSYKRLNRKPEALREVVNILQRQSSPDTAVRETAGEWKRRTGNELAAEFYDQGDFRSALAIYQALAGYSAKPDWRWPAVYQIGLCFERLGLLERARQAYEQILAWKTEEATAAEELGASLQALSQMAQWRLDHLDWESDLLARLNTLNAEP